jgi:predicted RNA binding protein YcfA (HicA-like mRNA interferase family)
MADNLPVITGKQLVRLFRQDGWEEKSQRAREGIFFYKRFPDGTVRATVIAPKPRPLTPGTLAAIPGPTQSGIDREGLAAMIARHGV